MRVELTLISLGFDLQQFCHVLGNASKTDAFLIRMSMLGERILAPPQTLTPVGQALEVYEISDVPMRYTDREPRKLGIKEPSIITMTLLAKINLRPLFFLQKAQHSHSFPPRSLFTYTTL